MASNEFITNQAAPDDDRIFSSHSAARQLKLSRASRTNKFNPFAVFLGL